MDIFAIVIGVIIIGVFAAAVYFEYIKKQQIEQNSLKTEFTI